MVKKGTKPGFTRAEDIVGDKLDPRIRHTITVDVFDDEGNGGKQFAYCIGGRLSKDNCVDDPMWVPFLDGSGPALCPQCEKKNLEPEPLEDEDS